MHYFGNPKHTQSMIVYILGAQPYVFEPHWLITTIWAAHFHFWSFHALSCREFHSSEIV